MSVFRDAIRPLAIKGFGPYLRILFQSNDNDLTYVGIFRETTHLYISLIFIFFFALNPHFPQHGTPIASYLAEHLCVLWGRWPDRLFVNAFTVINQVLGHAFRPSPPVFLRNGSSGKKLRRTRTSQEGTANWFG